MSHYYGPRIEGSKVQWYPRRTQAESAAIAIGWPKSCVTPVHTRFQAGYALCMGIDRDPYTGLTWLSVERYGELLAAYVGTDRPQ